MPIEGNNMHGFGASRLSKDTPLEPRREYTKDGLRDIGWALAQLRNHSRVRRAGWKGMWLILVPGSIGLKVEEGRPLAQAGLPVGMTFAYLPHVDMYTAQDALVPWLCSQTDLLATDWELA